MYVGIACLKVCKQGSYIWYESEAQHTKPPSCMFSTLEYNCSVKDVGIGLLYIYLHFYIIIPSLFAHFFGAPS